MLRLNEAHVQDEEGEMTIALGSAYHIFKEGQMNHEFFELPYYSAETLARAEPSGIAQDFRITSPEDVFSMADMEACTPAS